MAQLTHEQIQAKYKARKAALEERKKIVQAKLDGVNKELADVDAKLAEPPPAPVKK